MHKLDTLQSLPLFGVAALRTLETLAAKDLPPHTLMQRAGLAVARLALAVAPHAQRIWVACGPGNNGGDGLEAAMHLRRWGKDVVVTWLGQEGTAPEDAAASWRRLQEAGIGIAKDPPDSADLCIDALLGIGSSRPPTGPLAEQLRAMHVLVCPLLCVDVPSGLCADTGTYYSNLIANSADEYCRKQVFTLSLLGLKPGLFTHQGRDACGEVWWDDLDCPQALTQLTPTALLNGFTHTPSRAHASHKGSFGDVLVLGGAPGMGGAALLAADAALHAGAGRVYVSLLDNAAPHIVPTHTALMLRRWDTLDMASMTVVCGCGGGDAVFAALPAVIAQAGALVLDADALNQVAAHDSLQTLLRKRSHLGRATVITPHPLEAARILSQSTAQVQSDRLAAAQALAQRLGTTAVLKGSGTVIASPGKPVVINPTGNARLATGGTGDVLAGLIGARLARGMGAHEAACTGARQHGALVDAWPINLPLTADQLARSLLA